MSTNMAVENPNELTLRGVEYFDTAPTEPGLSYYETGNPLESLQHLIKAAYYIRLSLSATGYITREQIDSVPPRILFDLAQRHLHRIRWDGWADMGADEYQNVLSHFSPGDESEVSPIRGPEAISRARHLLDIAGRVDEHLQGFIVFGSRVNPHRYPRRQIYTDTFSLFEGSDLDVVWVDSSFGTFIMGGEVSAADYARFNAIYANKVSMLEKLYACLYPDGSAPLSAKLVLTPYEICERIFKSLSPYGCSVRAQEVPQNDLVWGMDPSAVHFVGRLTHKGHVYSENEVNQALQLYLRSYGFQRKRDEELAHLIWHLITP